ncbi:DUF7824 domain-containing protein, partial [Actinomadura fibrosa]
APAAPEWPPPYRPRPAPPPIESPAALAGAFLERDGTPADTERFLAALVELAHREPDATAEALGRVAAATAPWLHANIRPHHDITGVNPAVQSLLRENRRLRHRLALRRSARPWAAGLPEEPPIPRFLRWRNAEIAFLLGKVPVLLAAPTSAAGHVDPAALVGRLERYEELGAKPGRADLVQALLRVPREINPAAVDRASRLPSKAGRTVASWLARGGLPDPGVECEIVDEPGQAVRTSVRLGDDVPSDIVRLCTGADPLSQAAYFHEDATRWVATLPSHREVVAAHIVPYATGTFSPTWGRAAFVLALAEADGPPGTATAVLLAHALADPDTDERATAVNAFLTFSARGHLPADALGDTAGRLTALRRLALGRFAASLNNAANAGANADVWTVIAAALPHVLPGPGDSPPFGLHDLLAAGTRTAEASRARAAIPALAAVAARRRTSRLVLEAGRLHRVLTTAT